MKRRLPTFFETSSEPLEQRIATGLHKLGLAMKQQTWMLANEDGLSPTQGQILAALSTDGARTGTELSNQLGLTLPTISDSVRALVDKGLVSKKPDPRHPRASLLELTGRGRDQATKTRSWPDFLAAAVHTLSVTEQEVLHTALVKMIRTLQEGGQIPTHRMCVTCKHFRPNVHTGAMPHHCAFVDAPMASTHVRIDCPEHEPATSSESAAVWELFSRSR